MKLRTRFLILLPSLLLLLAACAAPPPYPASALGRAVAIQAEAAPLDPSLPSRRQVGPLSFLGGLALRSSDPVFGGLSGLALTPRGELKAISDQGWWLRARLSRDPAGRPLGLSQGRMGPLLGLDGLPLQGKPHSDAEGLAVWRGGFLVTFERNHRLWFYPPPDGLSGRPRALVLPAWLAGSPWNRGVEAVTVLADGRLLLLAERSPGPESTRGALGDGHRWQRVTYPLRGGFCPTALAGLPSGGCLVLERAYSLAAGARARLMHLSAEQLAAGGRLRPGLVAELAPPLTTDNFEGLAVLPAGPGRLALYLLSDDNFNSVQRTLLLAFEMRAPGQ